MSRNADVILCEVALSLGTPNTGWFAAGVRGQWSCLVEKVLRVTGTGGFTSPQEVEPGPGSRTSASLVTLSCYLVASSFPLHPSVPLSIYLYPSTCASTCPVTNFDGCFCPPFATLNTSKSPPVNGDIQVYDLSKITILHLLT